MTRLADADLADECRREVKALEAECSTWRTEIVLSKARERISTTETEKEIRTVVADAARSLFRSVDSVGFGTLRGDDIELEYPLEELPNLKFMKRWEGHLGQVIEFGNSLYQPCLSSEDRIFKGEPTTALKTAFTIKMHCGWEDLPGAVQVRSLVTDACGEKAVRDSFEQFVAWAGEQAVKVELKRELKSARLTRRQSGDWREDVLDLLLGGGQDLATILKTKRNIIKRFAEELKSVGGDNCIASSIRSYNSVSQELAYAVCVGEAWNRQAREKVYGQRTRSAGTRALGSRTAIYFENVTHRDFLQVLGSTVSEWAKRYVVSGAPNGVVSLDWNVIDGCDERTRQKLESLVTQFEAVLDAVAAKETVLYQKLQAIVRRKEPASLSTLTREIAGIFDASDCTIFIDRDGEQILHLLASTHPDKAPQVHRRTYPFGHGITGWVAKHCKTVCIQDPDDAAELAEIAERYEITDPIRDSRRVPLGTGAVLLSPLVARGRVVGVIRVAGYRKTDISHEDEVFLLAIGERLGHEFDQIWIEEDYDEKIRSMEGAARSQDARNVAPDFSSSLGAVLEEAAVSSGADSAYLRLHDPVHGLVCVRTRGCMRALQAAELALPLVIEPTWTQDIWQKQEWLELRGYLNEELGSGAPELVRAGAFLPLLGDDLSAKASLGMFFPSQPRWMRPEEANEFLAKLKGRVSASLQAVLRLARTDVRLRKESKSSLRLFNVAQASASATTVAELAEVVYRGAQEETGMDEGVVRLFDAERNIWSRAAPRRVFGEHSEIFPDQLVTNYALRRCMDSKEPIWDDKIDKQPGWINDWQSLPPGPRQTFLKRVKTWIAVPMWIGDDFLGGILMQSANCIPKNQDTIRHLQILGGFAATAIHAAQTRQKQLDIAEPFALVGTMLGGFLHQIRNELTAAVAYWDNLRRLPGLPEKAKERLGRLEGSLGAIGSICRGLTSFDPDPNALPQRIKVNELLDEVWIDLSRGIDLGRYDLKQSYDIADPTIVGSRIQVETAIRMLVQNAIEAVDEAKTKRRTICLETKVRNKRIVVRIADSGCGMSIDVRRKALRPFFTTKDVGNGLGLAIVSQVASRNGARLSLRSREGRGTVVSLQFPVEGANRG